MSQIARVFVVVNLLIAAGFIFAAASFLGLSNDHKAQLAREVAGRKADNAENSQKLSAKDTEISRLETVKSGLESTGATLAGANKQMEMAIKQDEVDKRAKDGQISQLQKDSASMQDRVKSAQDAQQRFETENKKLLGDVADAQKKERDSNDGLTKARGDIRTHEATIATHEKKNTDLARDNHEQKLIIEAALKAGFNPGGMLAMEPVKDARVLAVDMSSKFVQVNAGSNMKVSRGYTLDIVRAGRYIGQMTVDQVYADSCAGTLRVTTPGESVMVGDRATNTLN